MVQISWRALLLGGLALLPTAGVAQGLPTPKDASLYIISPKVAVRSGVYLVCAGWVSAMRVINFLTAATIIC